MTAMARRRGAGSGSVAGKAAPFRPLNGNVKKPAASGAEAARATKHHVRAAA